MTSRRESPVCWSSVFVGRILFLKSTDPMSARLPNLSSICQTSFLFFFQRQQPPPSHPLFLGPSENLSLSACPLPTRLADACSFFVFCCCFCRKWKATVRFLRRKQIFRTLSTEQTHSAMFLELISSSSLCTRHAARARASLANGLKLYPPRMKNSLLSLRPCFSCGFS